MKTKDIELFRDHYKAGKYPQPSTMLTSSVSQAYYLAWARYVYSLYAGGGAFSCPDNMYSGRSMRDLRDYSMGRQSVDRYRKILDVKMQGGTIHEGALANVSAQSLLNISWDNWSFFPKYLKLAIAKAIEVEQEPIIRATDTKARSDRRKKYAKARLASDPRMKQLFAATGVVPDDVAKYTAMQPNQIDSEMADGGFALEFEAILQDVCQITLDRSGFKQIRRQLMEDRCVLNRMGVEVYHAASDNALKIRYVDAASMIIPASKYYDHRDDAFRAYIDRTNIASIRYESGLEEKELWEIAKSYSKFGTNESHYSSSAGSNMYDFSWRTQYAAENGGQVYDNFTVDVMRLWFIANEVESTVIGYNEDGSLFSERFLGEYELSDEQKLRGFSVSSSSIQYVYKVNWVVGTNKVYGCEKDHTIVRVGDFGEKQAMIPFLVWASPEPSMTESCVAIINDIQLAVLKTRLLVSSLPPGPRMIIDMSVLHDSVSFGSKSFNMKDMLKLFGATGKLLVRSRNEHSMSLETGSNKNPVLPVDVDVQSDFNLFANVIATGLDMIRQVTGLNEIADGTGNASNVLNYVAKGFQGAANNAIADIHESAGVLYQNMVSLMVRKYQCLALHGRLNVHDWPIEANAVRILTIPDDVYLYNFDVSVRNLPTQEEIQLMIATISQRRQENKINEADLVILMGMLREKDLSKAALYLSEAISRADAAKQQHDMAMIQQQAKANADAATAIEASKQKTEDIKHRSKVALAEQEALLNEKQAESDHKRALELLERQHELGMLSSVIDAGMK